MAWSGVQPDLYNGIETYRILNHPEIVKRRRLTDRFNSPAVALEWLNRSGISPLDVAGNITKNNLHKVDESDRFHRGMGWSDRDTHYDGHVHRGPPPKTRYNGSTLEELMEGAYKNVARDRSRLSNIKPAIYPGKTRVAASPLETRERALRGKAYLPYQKKIKALVEAEPQNFSVEDIKAQLNRIKGDFATDQLKDRFRSSYTPRVENFEREDQNAFNSQSGEMQYNLHDLGDKFVNLQLKHNNAAINELSNQAGLKIGRRDLLIDNLSDFSKQKNAFGNLKLKAEEERFNREAKAPYERLDQFEAALNQIRPSINDDIHPDIEKSKTTELQNLTKKYQLGTPHYTGELIAGSNAYLDQSQNSIVGLSSKFKDQFYDQRKAAEKNLMQTGLGSTSSDILDNLNSYLQKALDHIESRARNVLNDDLGRISNKHIRRNGHGSPAHIREAEKRALEINEVLQKEKANFLQRAIQNKIDSQDESSQYNLNRLAKLGHLGTAEYASVIKNIRDVNKIGTKQWEEDQLENQELYKNFQNEANWQIPQLMQSAKLTGKNDLAKELLHGLNVSEKDFDIDRIKNLPSELIHSHQGIADRDLTIEQLEQKLSEAIQKGYLQEANVIKAELESKNYIENIESYKNQLAEAQSALKGQQAVEANLSNQRTMLKDRYDAANQDYHREYNEYKRLYPSSTDLGPRATDAGSRMHELRAALKQLGVKV